MDDTKGIKRRDFLARIVDLAIITWGVVASSGVCYTGFKYLWPSRDMGKGKGSGKIDVDISDLPKGGMVKLKLKGEPVGLIEQNGAYFAVSLVCTHLGCILVWDEPVSMLSCPCHASVFDIHGNVMGGPAPKPLPTFNVQVLENKVIVG